MSRTGRTSRTLSCLPCSLNAHFFFITWKKIFCLWLQWTISHNTYLLNHCSFHRITNNTHTCSTWILESTSRTYPMICRFIHCSNNCRHSRCWIGWSTSEWLNLLDFTLTSHSQLFRIKLSRSTNERRIELEQFMFKYSFMLNVNKNNLTYCLLIPEVGCYHIENDQNHNKERKRRFSCFTKITSIIGIANANPIYTFSMTITSFSWTFCIAIGSRPSFNTITCTWSIQWNEILFCTSYRVHDGYKSQWTHISLHKSKDQNHLHYRCILKYHYYIVHFHYILWEHCQP